MKAKKSLGQNFLIDNNIINKIVDEVTADDNDLIIEIGPGRGALTSKLKEKNCMIIAYELDTDLKPILDKLESSKLKIIYQDILKSNILQDIKEVSYKDLYFVGNLPYYITTAIIEHIIDLNIDFSKFTIMIQKEVAERFMAKPKTKEYGYFTLVLKYFFDIKKVCDVSKNCFNPVPKVESAVISLTKRTDAPDVDKNVYFKFLKEAFKQKRKTLKNNLSVDYWEKTMKVLKKYNTSESVRAEELSEEIFVQIVKEL